MDAIAMMGSPLHHSSTTGTRLAGGFARLLRGGLGLRFLPLSARRNGNLARVALALGNRDADAQFTIAELGAGLIDFRVLR